MYQSIGGDLNQKKKVVKQSKKIRKKANKKNSTISHFVKS